ncbi:MAG: hypothetical protein ACLUD0_06240 [Eubacterium ramulus]
MDGGFEAMPWNFAASRRIAFTHLHPDHYQEQLTAAYCSQMAERGRQLTVYAPD